MHTTFDFENLKATMCVNPNCSGDGTTPDSVQQSKLSVLLEVPAAEPHTLNTETKFVALPQHSNVMWGLEFLSNCLWLTRTNCCGLCHGGYRFYILI